MRARLALLLLLGIVFLASVSVSLEEKPSVSYPFHLSSRRFHTLFKNQYGHIRVLQRFDQRSTQLQNLRDYRVSEFTSKPNTLLLPHHVDADSLLVVLSGRAIIIFVNPDNRESYYLDRGYAQRIPAGTTFYLVNPDDKENLRVIKLVISVNKPGNFVVQLFLIITLINSSNLFPNMMTNLSPFCL
uniref:Beta-conglycinin, beta chain n=1 Tax=Cajanus cajan TaxID=3821 RepID=A0A151U6V8_CAJCA|nr:Beta-conglycinin, beta chain [Cajanus cajan]